MGSALPPSSTSPIFVRALAQSCRALDIPVERIFSRFEIDAQSLALTNSRLPIAQLRAACLELQRQSGDTVLGLHLAERLPWGSLGLLDDAFQVCPTWGQALEFVLPYSRILANGGDVRWSLGERTFELSYHSCGGVGVLTDFTLATILVRARYLSGASIRPTQVWLPYSEPQRAVRAEYERLFCSNVLFRAAGPARMSLDRASLTVCFPGKDPVRLSALLSHLECADRELPHASLQRASEQSWLDVVRVILRACVHRGNPNICNVASLIGMSARSLQRRLRQVGTSHRQLLEEIREGMARDIAARGLVRRGIVARELGYSSARSLDRARQRWGGCPPDAGEP